VAWDTFVFRHAPSFAYGIQGDQKGT